MQRHRVRPLHDDADRRQVRCQKHLMTKKQHLIPNANFHEPLSIALGPLPVSNSFFRFKEWKVGMRFPTSNPQHDPKRGLRVNLKGHVQSKFSKGHSVQNYAPGSVDFNPCLEERAHLYRLIEQL